MQFTLRHRLILCKPADDGIESFFPGHNSVKLGIFSVLIGLKHKNLSVRAEVCFIADVSPVRESCVAGPEKYCHWSVKWFGTGDGNVGLVACGVAGPGKYCPWSVKWFGTWDGNVGLVVCGVAGPGEK